MRRRAVILVLDGVGIGAGFVFGVIYIVRVSKLLNPVACHARESIGCEPCIVVFPLIIETHRINIIGG